MSKALVHSLSCSLKFGGGVLICLVYVNQVLRFLSVIALFLFAFTSLRDLLMLRFAVSRTQGHREAKHMTKQIHISLLKLTQSLEELHDGDGHGVAGVVDGVVAELCDPALAHAVLGAGVHETVVDVHAHDGRAVGVDHLRERGCGS